jgi:hypothetical protein
MIAGFFRMFLTLGLLCFALSPGVAIADTLPIKEGVWAAPASACDYAKREPRATKEQDRWPINLTDETFKTAEKREHHFEYFDKKLEYYGYDQGECETKRIVGKGSRFRVTLRCSEEGEGGDLTNTFVEVKSRTTIVITHDDNPPEEYSFCEQVK